MRLTRAAVLAAALALTIGLGGCISLLPKSKPAQLYRFGIDAAQANPANNQKAAFGVLKPPAGFQRAAATDRILTVTGSEAAYIAEARWLAPAQSLFDEAVTQAFDNDNGPARLVSRGEIRRADYTLRLDVRSFEARYSRGAKEAPDIVVTVNAVLVRGSDRMMVGDRTFTATVRAGDNRVGAIVEAFNQALGKILPDLAKWVDSAGPAPN